MEERSLRVYQQKTFFSKIGTTISKILIPTKIGFNGMMISVKRNNLLKSYEVLKEFNVNNIKLIKEELDLMGYKEYKIFNSFFTGNTSLSS